MTLIAGPEDEGGQKVIIYPTERNRSVLFSKTLLPATVDEGASKFLHESAFDLKAQEALRKQGGYPPGAANASVSVRADTARPMKC